MPGDEIQPELLVPLLFAMWACTVGPMFCCLAIFFGHWKPDLRLWIRRTGHMLIFSAVLVIGSYSQNRPAMADELDRVRGQFEGYKDATDARLGAIEQRLSGHVSSPWHQPIYDMHKFQQEKHDRDMESVRSALLQLILWTVGGFLTLATGGGVMLRSLHKTTQRVETTIKQNGGSHH